jgi:prepilin-type N-terminal cleavage/methylation domain-containing protein
MKRGFTLIELIVVIIIIGILAAVGLTQYSKIVEKGRGAEARRILGDMRKLAYDYYLQNGTYTGITNADFNLGTGSDKIPGACTSTHYFWYGAISWTSATTFYACGTRCSSGGKSPQGTYVTPYNSLCYVETWGQPGSWEDYSHGKPWY